MEKKKLSPSVPYDDGLIEDLKDPEFSVIYLNAILEDTDKGVKERFLNALSLVAKAHGISKLVAETNLQRESLRKALSEKGNPTIATLFSLLKAFGLRIHLASSSNSVREGKKNSKTTISSLQTQLTQVQKTVEQMAKTLTEHTETRAASRTPSQTFSVGAEYKTVNTVGDQKYAH